MVKSEFSKSQHMFHQKSTCTPPRWRDKMCKLTKNLPRGLLDFQDSRGEDLTRGRGNSGGLRLPLELCPVIGISLIW